MTKEEWAALEKALGTPYSQARVRADGHVLTIQPQQRKPLKYELTVYIDGWIKGEWMVGEPPEEVRKFWRLRKKFLFSATKRAEWAALAKKRGMPKDFRNFCAESATACSKSYSPCWPSAKALCAHLRKTCASVERLPDFED